MTLQKGFTTDELMQFAMDMVGQKEIPADSMIYVPGENIKKILFGIDMGVAEILVGTKLGVDCVMAHHPDRQCMTFPEIFEIHYDLMVKNGVPEKEAREATNVMKSQRYFAQHSANYDHAPSFARLLGMPFLNIHNPLDEIGRRRMQEAIDSRINPDSTVADVIDALNTIDEIRNAPTDVELRLGNLGNRAGKTVVVHAAGTNGGAALARLYFNHGVDTIVYIHISPAEALRLAQEFPIGKNLVISGHIASDLAGINPYVELLESKGVFVIRVSGI